MVIPNKFNGYSFDGSRRCFGGGGGGGGAGGDGGTGDAASAAGGAVGPGASGTGNGTGDGGGGAPGGGGGGDFNNIYTPPTNITNTTNTNPNASYANFGSTGVYGGPGVSTQQGYDLIAAQRGNPWGQSGGAYNDLLNLGFTSNQIRNSASTMYGAPSDANWGAMVQNAGMNSPTGRPMAGSDQFFQPVYNSSYMNYARPATQFDVSMYGTQPVQSPASASGMSRGNINSAIGNYFQQNPNSDINSTLPAMRSSGINRSDVQQWGGVNNYGPQMSMPQMQTPFNPYASGYGQQPQNPFSFQQPSYQPQMQTPFSYQQPSYQQQSYQPSYQQQSYQPSYQQQSYQPSYQPNYQSSYGGYGSYGGDFGGGVGMYTPVTQQSYQPQYRQDPTPPVEIQPPQRVSSGPTTPIVGRSSGFRGTPNVMRRAEGGIASLMDDVE